MHLFFGFFKQILCCRHLYFRSENGIKLQAYCAIIACMLTSLRNFTPSARVLPPLLSPAASRLTAKWFGHYQTLGDWSQSSSLVRRARVGTANALRRVVIKGFGRQGCAASPLGLPAAPNSPPRLPIRQSPASLGRPASLPSVPPLPGKQIAGRTVLGQGWICRGRVTRPGGCSVVVVLALTPIPHPQDHGQCGLWKRQPSRKMAASLTHGRTSEACPKFC